MTDTSSRKAKEGEWLLVEEVWGKKRSFWLKHDTFKRFYEPVTDEGGRSSKNESPSSCARSL